MFFKKILATVSAVAMLITTASLGSILTAFAVDKYPTSGQCGDNAEWFINSDGVLVISGEGEMSGSHGWTKFNNDINEVLIEDGITFASHNAFAFTYYVSKISFPPSITKLNGCFDPNTGNYKYLRDIYIYSRNISDASSIYNPIVTVPWPGSGVTWHVYEGSTTEESLRNDAYLTDKDIEYIPDNEQMPVVDNHKAAELETITDISGPSGLNSKWEWNELSKTLEFSGKGSISIDDDYKKYSKETEHIVIQSEITKIMTTDDYDKEIPSNGAFSGFIELKDVQLPDELTTIGNYSFYQTALTNVDLPSTLERIGVGAFEYTNIENISFPKTLKTIGEAAFQGTKLNTIELYEGMTIDGHAFAECNLLNQIIIPKDVTFNQSVIGGNGMPRPHATFFNCLGLEKVIVENGVSELVQAMFDNCTSLKNIYLYTTNLQSIISGFNSTFPKNEKITFHLYKDTTTEQTLRDAGYLTDENTVYLATEDSIDKLDESIKEAEAIDTSKYTEDTIAALNEAIDIAKTVLDKYNSEKYPDVTLDEVNEAIQTLNDAIDNLKYLPADYTAVDEAIAKIPADLSKYTDESVKVLNDALAAVNRDLDINSQNTVDGYAKAIEDAIKGLVEKTTTPSSSQPTSSSDVKPTTPKPTTATTRSPSQVAKDKSNADKIMKQAKITKFKVKSKSKKKITVTWKKVKKAVGYQVQVSKNKKFKKGKIVFDKHTKKNTLKISNKKINSGKTYYVRVRAYATYKDTNSNTQKVYSSWIKKIRKVKVK